MRVDGRPWSLSLYKISKYDVPLYEKLGEDGLVQTTWTDAVLSTLPRILRKCQELYTLNDTFVVDFSSQDLYITVITEEKIETLRVRVLRRD